MAYVLGLFENGKDALSAIDGLTDAGISEDKISVLSREHLTEEHDQTVYEKRAADLGGFAGMMAGGYAGMFAGVALATIPGIGLGLATGALAVVLGMTGGGAVGAATGAVVGHKVVPSLMTGLGINEDDANFYAEAVKREGVLVAVDTEAADEEKVKSIMLEKSAINIEEKQRQWRSEGWQRFDESSDIDITNQNVATS